MSSNNAYKVKGDDEPVLAHTGWSHLTVPPPSECNYAITGHESQIVTLQLSTGDSCKGEPGSMMYLTPGVQQHASCDGFCERCCSGEDCCVMNFTNSGAAGDQGFVALTPNFPTAKVVPVNLSQVGGSIICQQGAFMASYGEVNVSISLDCNLLRCCCGGLGLVRQKLEGNGTVFLEGTGTMVQKILAVGETILVDTECVMAFANSCKLDLKRAGGVLGILGGGEGFFNTTLTGPGLVIIQSMNATVFREALAADKLYRR